MSPNLTSEPTLEPPAHKTVDIPLPPTDLPYDDGEPLESNRHRLAMNTLIWSIQQAWTDRNDFFCGGNMFIYFSTAQVRNQDFRGPDFFVVLNIDGSYSRESWIVWEEGGRYPDVIVELLSPSTAEVDFGKKKDIYEQTFRTPDYFVFDPFDPTSLRGWHLNANQKYEPLVPNEQGWLWSPSLELWLGTWSGTIERHPGVWLRFYDINGVLVATPQEVAQQQAAQAQQQAAQAQQQAAQAQQQAAQSQQQAAQSQQQAAQAEQQAAQAEQQAAQAEQQAAQSQQRAEQLAAQLRALGVEPEA